MAEEGDVLAEGSALVEREEDLDELRRSTAALTKMMQTVLQRIDAMASVQGGTSGQDVGRGESSAFDITSGRSNTEAGGCVEGVTSRRAASVQGSSPPRTAGVQGPSPREQQMAGPIPSASSSYWWETVDVFVSSSVVVTVSGVPSMGGTGGVHMPQGPKFDDSGTKFSSWVNAKQCGLLRGNIHYSIFRLLISE